MSDGGVGLIPIVDTLQVPMVLEHGKAKGFRNRKMKLGGWVLNRPLKIEHDFCGNGKAGVFCKLSGDLWAYVLSAPDVLMCLLLDGGKLCSAFGGGSFELSIKHIEPAIVAGFKFNQTTDKWEQALCVSDLVKRYRAAGMAVSVSSSDF